ncbi:MAG: hypothetical protein QM791_06175 [Ferruginibacter sp.]
MAKRINPKFINVARKNDDLKYDLAKKNNVKISTINRWLEENAVMLTTADSLEVWKEHMDVLETAELLVELAEA